MDTDLISIIVPVYNVEKYIRKCIDSILNQTYINLEIILIDDGSLDNSGKICDEYAKNDKRIIVIHKKNGGLSEARNTGLDIAKGKYVCFIDSDDYVEKDYVEFLYKILIDNRCRMSICSHTVIYENGKKFDLSTYKKEVLDTQTVLERMLYHNGIDLSAWAKLYDIKLFENVRFPIGRLFEDAATTYKLICKCDKIACGQISKYNYMIRNNSITTKDFDLKKMDLIKSTNEMCDFILKKYPSLKNATTRRLVYAHLSTLTQLAKSKKSFPNEQKELMNFINKNKFKVLFNPKAPKRDKVGIVTTMFRLWFF